MSEDKNPDISTPYSNSSAEIPEEVLFQLIIKKHLSYVDLFKMREASKDIKETIEEFLSTPSNHNHLAPVRIENAQTFHKIPNHLKELILKWDISCLTFGINLENLPPNTVLLALENWASLNLKDFSDLIALKSLNLKGSNITADSFATVSNSLEEANLSSCQALKTYPYLTHEKKDLNFGKFIHLRTINLSSTEVTAKDVETLPPTLIGLNLKGCWELDTAKVNFSKFKNLEVLNLNTYVSAPEIIENLPKSLIKLTIPQYRFSDTARDADFSSFVHLETLICKGSDITPKGIATLPDTLKTIEFNFCHNIAGADFSRLINLSTAAFSDMSITAAEIATLPDTLIELELSDCATLDLSTVDFNRFKNLRTLNLTSMTSFTPDVIAQLAMLKNVEIIADQDILDTIDQEREKLASEHRSSISEPTSKTSHTQRIRERQRNSGNLPQIGG